MAYIVERTRTPRGKNAKPETSYQVKWNIGLKASNGGASETFRDPKKAAHFKSAVELAGGNYPPNFIPGLGDDGWVDPETYLRLTTGNADTTPAAPTFAEFAEEVVKSLSGIQGFTRSRYRRIVELHIAPWFGHARIDDVKAISPLTIGSWINDLEAGTPAPGTDDPRDDLKPKTIRNVHGLFYAIMQAAVDAEPPWRSKNPAGHTTLPRLDDGEGDEEMVFLTQQEFDTIYRHLKDDAKDLAEFLVSTGLRYSEATALQVQDLDLLAARPRLKVRRSWKRQDDGTWKYGPPKTPKSRRNVGLAAWQVDKLLPLVVDKRPKDLVFVGPGGDRWIHQTFYMSRWRPAVYASIRCEFHREQDRQAGIGVLRTNRFVKNEDMQPCGCAGMLEQTPRIHDLRHTNVAWLIAKNLQLPVIQRRLGHESIQTTVDRYGHLLPELEDDVIAAVDTFRVRSTEAALV